MRECLVNNSESVGNSHSFKYNDFCVLGSYVVQSGRKVPVFPSNLFPPNLLSCRWTQCSSKTLLSIYEATQCHVLEDSNILFTSCLLDKRNRATLIEIMALYWKLGSSSSAGFRLS